MYSSLSSELARQHIALLREQADIQRLANQARAARRQRRRPRGRPGPRHERRHGPLGLAITWPGGDRATTGRPRSGGPRRTWPGASRDRAAAGG
jgi:hypothetical protein